VRDRETAATKLHPPTSTEEIRSLAQLGNCPKTADFRALC
jgi:hypothetical protein